ncbi:MAG: PQ-loop repeat-containing protein [Patescibacteria group bacterium]
MVKILGTLAVCTSLTIVLLGLPRQIYRNWKRKSCEGIEPTLFYAVFCTYTLWGLYGFTKPDWFIFASQTPGFILTIVILVQLRRYGTNPRRME